VREITAEYLRQRGYNVIEAEDAATALAVFEATSALDLLITDVGLPNGVNGRQLAGIIRETSPSLPVLFITGYAGAAGIEQLEPGMTILTKPFTLPALIMQVEAMLNAETHAARATAD
jgi:CheY-like chemotaxis protein